MTRMLNTALMGLFMVASAAKCRHTDNAPPRLKNRGKEVKPARIPDSISGPKNVDKQPSIGPNTQGSGREKKQKAIEAVSLKTLVIDQIPLMALEFKKNDRNSLGSEHCYHEVNTAVAGAP